MRGRHGVLAERPHAWLTSGDEVSVRATSASFDPGSRRSAGLGRMTTMVVIGITGSTDRIGRATARGC
jgi:hypothetical protein